MSAAERIAALKAASTGRPHGLRARYMAGCRCLVCRAANARYSVERAAAIRAGDRRGFVPAGRVLRHLRRLSRQGVGYRSVAAAASVSKTMLVAVLGGHRTRLRASTERAVLAVDAGARADRSLIPAGPTWRRIDSLLAEGYTKRQIAEWCGWKRAIQLPRGRITARSASRVERVARLIEAGRLRRER